MLVGLLAISAIAVTFLLIRLFRGGRLEWDAGSWFILVVGSAFELNLLVSKLSGSVYLVDSETGTRSLETSAWSQFVPPHQAIVLGAVAVALMVSISSGRSVRIPAPAALWISFVLLALVVDYVRYGNPPSGEPLLMLAAIVGACAACRSREGAIAGAAVFALGLCVLGGFTAMVNPESVLQSCTVKCSVSGVLYSGVASHGNSLGLILAVALPFVWFAFNGRARLVLVGYILLNLGLTGSRSSIIASLVVLCVLMITRPGIGNGILRGRRPSVGFLAALVAAFVSFILPWLVTDPDFATGRGRLWNLAQQLSMENLLFGQGSTSWFREYSAGSFGRAAAYSSHNQWVEVTLFLGIVGILLFAAIVWLFLVPSENRLLVAPIVVAIFALGVTERPIALALVDLMSWALFALFMISNCNGRTTGHQKNSRVKYSGESVSSECSDVVAWTRERSATRP